MALYKIISKQEGVQKYSLVVETRLTTEYSKASQTQMCQKLADREQTHALNMLYSTAKLMNGAHCNGLVSELPSQRKNSTAGHVPSQCSAKMQHPADHLLRVLTQAQASSASTYLAVLSTEKVYCPCCRPDSIHAPRRSATRLAALSCNPQGRVIAPWGWTAPCGC